MLDRAEDERDERLARINRYMDEQGDVEMSQRLLVVVAGIIAGVDTGRFDNDLVKMARWFRFQAPLVIG